MPNNQIVKKRMVSDKPMMAVSPRRETTVYDPFEDRYCVVYSGEVMEHRLNVLMAKSANTVMEIMSNQTEASKDRLSAVSKAIELAKFMGSKNKGVEEEEMEDDLDDLSMGNGIDDEED